MFNEEEEDIDSLLAVSVGEAEAAYSGFVGDQTNVFLLESYHDLNTAYKAIVCDLSPVYCSGSDWYCGENLTVVRFHETTYVVSSYMFYGIAVIRLSEWRPLSSFFAILFDLL